MTRGQLRQHLLATRIAGDVATPRESNLENYRRFAERDPALTLGLRPTGAWTEADVLALLAERCGVRPEPTYRQGPDRIDPDRTLDALDAYADAVGRAARDRRAVLIGTGHPAPLLDAYSLLADALAHAGCAVRTPGRGRELPKPAGRGAHHRTLDYVERVGVVRAHPEDAAPSGSSSGGSAPAREVPARHTHSPEPVRLALAALAEDGEPLPGLVVGDHGWVCGAAALDVPAIGFADCNDPALFVAEAEGRAAVTVPLDDGVRSDYYGPLMRYVLQRAGL